MRWRRAYLEVEVDKVHGQEDDTSSSTELEQARQRVVLGVRGVFRVLLVERRVGLAFVFVAAEVGAVV